jgi:hypothetical protein
MRLVVSKEGTVSLLEPADLRRFKLVIEDPAMPLDAVRTVLGPLGTVEDESAAWIAADGLRGLGALAGDPGWQDGVTEMLAAAARHGWVDATGAVRAHIERGG